VGADDEHTCGRFVQAEPSSRLRAL
jgi:hypothetical protein